MTATEYLFYAYDTFIEFGSVLLPIALTAALTYELATLAAPPKRNDDDAA